MLLERVYCSGFSNATISLFVIVVFLQPLQGIFFFFLSKIGIASCREECVP